MNNSTYKNANTCFITKKIASIGQRVYNVFTNITYAKANRRDDEVAFLMQPTPVAGSKPGQMQTRIVFFRIKINLLTI